MSTHADYAYEVWRRGGNPDAIDPDDVPRDYDWVWDEPLPEHLPATERGNEHERL